MMQNSKKAVNTAPARHDAKGASGNNDAGGQGEGGKFAFDFFGLLCLCATVLLLISLASFDLRDPGLNHVVRGSAKIYNWAGMVGAYLSSFMVDFLGFAAYVPFFFMATLSARLFRKGRVWPWWRWAAFILLGLCLAAAGQAWGIGLGPVRGGGLIGHSLYGFSVKYFSHIGSGVIWFFLFLLAIQSIGGFTWPQLAMRLVAHVRAALAEAGRLDAENGKASANVPAAAGSDAGAADSSGSTVPFAMPHTQNTPQNSGPVIVEPYRAATANAAIYGGQAAQQGVAAARGAALPSGGRPQAKADTSGSSERAPLISISASSEPLPEGGKGVMAKLFGTGKKTSGAALPPEEAPAQKSARMAAKRSPEYQDDTPPWLEALEADTLNAPQKPQPQPERRITAAPSPATGSVLQQKHGAESSLEPKAVTPAEPAFTPKVIIDEQYQAAAQQPPKPARMKAKLPPLDLLHPVEDGSQAVSRKELEDKGQSLMSCLHDFSIQAELVRITPGPVVTSFEVRPAPGVKSARIAGLSDDIAMGLKATAVRIQAPIPGTDTVGIEIPNARRELVGLRELVASPSFQQAESLLTLALGKDISGVPTTADLAKMPHMLVAGATGTGKSVFLNSVLMSFLYKARPEEVNFLLVDPKRIEMAVYADLPHLVHPIVTDMALAKNALDWAVAEMERRYDAIARLGVRNVASYNEKLKEMGDKRPQNLADLAHMPYLVLIIDELADLMLTAGKDVETSIVRLAQLARAAGIHLIIATQRPSVDVVTGLIKANFPCRISFQVTSKHDSRTILDTVGAEHLLGRGDMLYKPAGGRFQRLHGAFVSDEDVAAVADYWRAQQKPNYQVDFAEYGSETAEASAAMEFSGEDQRYNEAVEFVRQQGKASISLIQRRFRIGFNGAARIIEQMEQDGIIGPADGSKPRIVR